MRNLKIGKFVPVLLALAALTFVSCGSAPGEIGTEIISAEQALDLVKDGAVLVDAQKGTTYAKMHVSGAVNISRADIVVNEPVPNILAPASRVEEVLGSRGISNDSHVVIYDNNNNMDSARLWWTMKIYGHEKVQVISGGWEALGRAGASFDGNKVSLSPASYSAKALRSEWIASSKEVREFVDSPEGMNLIDVRSQEEYDEGTIPGSVLLNYVGNNFKDGTYKPAQQIQIRYLEKNIGYDDTAVMYCKSSIRAAQTFLAMYNAGYRNLKIYDGAWLEWTKNPMNPIHVPNPATLMLESEDQS